MALRAVVAGAASLLLVLPGAPPARAHEVVTDGGTVRAHVVAHDPCDALELPGDTHVLHLDAELYEGRHRVVAELEHYACGPHVPLERPVASCSARGVLVAAADRPRVDVVTGDTVRVRGTIPRAGVLDVAVTGTAGAPFLARDLVRTVGTRHETLRTSERHGRVTAATGTLGGVALVQRPALTVDAYVRTTRNGTEVTTVPAAAVPRLDPPGTRDGDAVTVGEAAVAWSRRLPSLGPRGTLDVEVGRLRWEQRDTVPGPVEAEVQRQRCRAGQRLRPPAGPVPANPCAVLGARFGARSADAIADVRTGRLHAVVDLPRRGGRPPARVDLTWHGSRPLGVLEVDRYRGSADQAWFRLERSGVRWADLRVTGTIGGRAPNRWWAAGFDAWRQVRTREPATTP
jgi:hypothetical protein